MIITVQSIEWPQAGKKQGSVTDTSGRRWGVWADKLANYVVGQSYEITFKTNDFQGKTYFTIQTALPVAAGANVSQQGLMQQPAPRSAMAAMGHPPNDDQRRMDIFVCGAFNHMMSNPNIKPDEMPAESMAGFITMLKRAWKATLGPQPDPISSGPAKGHGDDMSDEIPFGPETRG